MTLFLLWSSLLEVLPQAQGPLHPGLVLALHFFIFSFTVWITAGIRKLCIIPDVQGNLCVVKTWIYSSIPVWHLLCILTAFWNGPLSQFGPSGFDPLELLPESFDIKQVWRFSSKNQISMLRRLHIFFFVGPFSLVSQKFGPYSFKNFCIFRFPKSLLNKVFCKVVSWVSQNFGKCSQLFITPFTPSLMWRTWCLQFFQQTKVSLGLTGLIKLFKEVWLAPKLNTHLFIDLTALTASKIGLHLHSFISLGILKWGAKTTGSKNNIIESIYTRTIYFFGTMSKVWVVLFQMMQKFDDVVNFLTPSSKNNRFTLMG